MTEKYHDHLCQIASEVLKVNWNSFETYIIDDRTILIELDNTGEYYLVKE